MLWKLNLRGGANSRFVGTVPEIAYNQNQPKIVRFNGAVARDINTFPIGMIYDARTTVRVEATNAVIALQPPLVVHPKKQKNFAPAWVVYIWYCT